MTLSNETVLCEDPSSELADRWMTVLAGILMILFSFFGININFWDFYSFTRMGNMSGFYILCSSKAISNNIILFCYFLYNGPVTLFNYYYGPELLNMVVTQTVSYGIYILGPLTQLLIAGNRLVVILFPSYGARIDGRRIPIICLSFCWLFSIFVTLVGFLGRCVDVFNYQVLTWVTVDPCVDVIANWVMYLVFALAIMSNSFNFIVASKLIFSSSNSSLDSVSNRFRKRKTRKLFLQNCFQDGVYLIDTINSMYIYEWSDHILFQFMFTIFSNLFVHVADGCIMLLFNYKRKQQSLFISTVQRKDLTMIVTT